ncbi:MAG TPA: DUF3617 domain-containing protein [Novosphingobium sp.]|nr:DUF3617 domain-containing protein [Novosphingobium sp.]
MTRLATISAVSAALLLSACGKSDTIEAKNESVEEVARKVAQSDHRPAPGKWESRVVIEKIAIEGMPPEMQEAMKGQMAKAQTSVTCLTPEQAAKNDAEFFKPGQASGCKYNHFKMGGGVIDADMSCDSQGMQQNMKMTGSYRADAYNMKVTAEGKMMAGTKDAKAMSMAMSVESKRIGQCDGKEEG